jgi:hypothetical protein
VNFAVCLQLVVNNTILEVEKDGERVDFDDAILFLFLGEESAEDGPPIVSKNV